MKSVFNSALIRPAIFAGTLAVTTLAVTTSTPVMASESITDALKEGKVTLNLRMRYEDVEWQGLQDSNALTLKTRLTYKSSDFNGLSMLLEMDDVTDLDEVDYRNAPNDTNNPGTAVIADPEGTEINQALLAYKAGDTIFTYGRQRILLDNQRFVGGVGFRQNEQTYDAFSIKNQSVEKLTFFYSYVNNVNRIFGESNPAGDLESESHLLNINYSGWSAGSLTGYAYLLDFEDSPVLSSDTIGLRFSGKAGDFSYTLEYATQSDGGDNPVSYDADYYLVSGGAKLGPVNLTLSYEVLGSDNGIMGFATPLATLHAFQGWTDRFLATPANGIEDLFLVGNFTAGGVKFTLSYHDLAADQGSADYGTEAGFQVAKSWDNYGISFKYADYSADTFGSDTTKYWLTATAKF